MYIFLSLPPLFKELNENDVLSHSIVFDLTELWLCMLHLQSKLLCESGSAIKNADFTLKAILFNFKEHLMKAWEHFRFP